MASNDQFNIGKDVTLSIISPSGALGTMGLLVEFDATPESATLTSLPINQNGIPVRRNTYQGWRGAFVYDRQNGNLDLLHNILESNFYAGNPDVIFQIDETIRNADGSTDHFIYRNCVISLENAGRYRQNDKVEQRFRWEASQRVGG